MLVNFLNLPGLEIPYHTDRMGNEALDGVRRRLKDTILGKLNLQLKRERKMLTMRQHELTDSQWLAVSGCLNNFPQLKAAYELKERYFKIWDFTTPEEALAEYLQWQESISPLKIGRASCRERVSSPV